MTRVIRNRMTSYIGLCWMALAIVCLGTLTRGSVLSASAVASSSHQHSNTEWAPLPESGKSLAPASSLASFYYEQVRYRWRDGTLEFDLPDSVDCHQGCDVDRCLLGACFEQYFDTNGDFQISYDEMQNALDTYMSWIERQLTSSGKDWVKKFDGADGSPKDHKASCIELISVSTSSVSCSDFSDAQHYLCDRARNQK